MTTSEEPAEDGQALTRERFELLQQLEDRMEMTMVVLGLAWLVLQPGETSRTVEIKVKAGRAGEAAETLVLNLLGVVGAAVLQAQGQATIPAAG